MAIFFLDVVLLTAPLPLESVEVLLSAELVGELDVPPIEPGLVILLVVEPVLLLVLLVLLLLSVLAFGLLRVKILETGTKDNAPFAPIIPGTQTHSPV